MRDAGDHVYTGEAHCMRKTGRVITINRNKFVFKFEAVLMLLREARRTSTARPNVVTFDLNFASSGGSMPHCCKLEKKSSTMLQKIEKREAQKKHKEKTEFRAEEKEDEGTQ